MSARSEEKHASHDGATAAKASNAATSDLGHLSAWTRIRSLLSPAHVTVVHDVSPTGPSAPSICTRFGSTVVEESADQVNWRSPQEHLVVISDRAVLTSTHDLPDVSPREETQIIANRLRDQFLDIYEDLAWTERDDERESGQLVVVQCVRRSAVLDRLGEAGSENTPVAAIGESSGWAHWLCSTNEDLDHGTRVAVVLDDHAALLLLLRDAKIIGTKSVTIKQTTCTDLANDLDSWAADLSNDIESAVVCARGNASPQIRELGVGLASHLECAFHVAPPSIAAHHVAASLRSGISIRSTSIGSPWKRLIPALGALAILAVVTIAAPLAAGFIADQELLHDLRRENALLADAAQDAGPTHDPAGRDSEAGAASAVALIDHVVAHLGADTRLQELHADAAGTVRLRGNCRTLSSALDLADALRESGQFAEVELTRMRTLDGDPIHEFEIALTGSPSPEGAP